MTTVEKFKSGEIVKQSGVYVDRWNAAKLLKKGLKFPKNPAMGETTWKLASYPYSSQMNSKNVPEEYRP